MTTLETWIHASMSTLRDSVNKTKEYLQAGDMEGLKIQLDTLYKQVYSYIDFLENKEKFG